MRSKVLEKEAMEEILLEQFSKKNIALVGLIDSIGEDKNKKQYLEELVSILKHYKANVQKINAHFRMIHKEESIRDLIASNISLDEIKRIQKQELNLYAELFLEEKRIPQDEKLKNIVLKIKGLDTPVLEKGDHTTHLRDVLIDSDEVFLFYVSNFDLLHNPVPNWYLAEQTQQRIRNFDYILSLNNHIQIFTFDFPNLRNSQIAKQNQTFQDLSKKYGCVPISLHSKSFSLAYGCFEKIMELKLQGHPKRMVQIYPSSIFSKNDGMDTLLNTSLERENEWIQSLRRGIPANNSFLKSKIQEEREQQKIYLKVKKEEAYFE